MKVIENRLVGENGLENAVLRNLVENKLYEFADIDYLEPVEVSDPGETGIMYAEAKWCHGSLDGEVWIEAQYHGPPPDDFESGLLCLEFVWTTPGSEYIWNEPDGIFEWADEESPRAGGSLKGKLIAT